jgi:predicted DNA-binding WGR domain protein
MGDLGIDLAAALDAIRSGPDVAEGVDLKTLDIAFDVRGEVSYEEVQAAKQAIADEAAAEQSRELRRAARAKAREQKMSGARRSRKLRAKAGVSEWFGRVEYIGETDRGNLSHKFWQCRVIKQKGRYLAQVRFGPIRNGVEQWGQTRIVGDYSFGSMAACKFELEKRQRAKLRKGYEHA